VQNVLKVVVVVRFMGSSSFEIVNHLWDVVGGTQAQDQVDMVAYNALFQEVNFQFIAFGGEEPSQKGSNLLIDQWVALVCDEDYVVVQGVAVMIGFVILSQIPGHGASPSASA